MPSLFQEIAPNGGNRPAPPIALLQFLRLILAVSRQLLGRYSELDNLRSMARW